MVKEPQKPAAKKSARPGDFLTQENSPKEHAAKRKQPKTLASSVCQGHAPFSQAISRRPYRTQEPRIPPQATQKYLFFIPYHPDINSKIKIVKYQTIIL